jgi:ribonuclease Z
MRPLFHPTLINGPTGDPGVFVECLFEGRGILFDLGDIRALATRKILRVSDILVSHAHMDHFFGFDWMLRVCLGRDRCTRMFGPPGFLAQVEHKLASYTWNLVHRYDTDFSLEVTEVDLNFRARRARFRCKAGFRRDQEEVLQLADGLLLIEEHLRVRALFLDHMVPCLAFALEEPLHVNVWKDRLDGLGIGTGPWLQDLKRAVLRGEPDETPIRAWWRDSGGVRERYLPLGLLKDQVISMGPGQKIVYVTDARYQEDNARKILELARDADVLFIEAPFLERDAQRAASRYHLTAAQAGTLARLARVRTVVPFHFSPIYPDSGTALTEELQAAYRSRAGIVL